MTPVEIMKRAIHFSRMGGDDDGHPLHPSDEYDCIIMATAAIAALEAAGWKLVHPEKVTEAMLDALCAEYRDDDCEKLSPLRKAIAAAPLHGKG